MLTFAASLLLYIVPAFLLFHMAFEVYHRNRGYALNRIAFIFFLLLGFLFVGNYLVRMTPEAYTSVVARLFYYFPAIVTLCVSLHFYLRMTERFRSMDQWKMIAICYGQLLPAFMLFFPVSWFGIDVVHRGLWNVDSPSIGIRLLILSCNCYSFVVSLILVGAGLSYVKKCDLNLKRKQFGTILLGVIVGSTWGIAFLLYERPSVIPHDLNCPDLGLFAILWFALFLRRAMLKYDFLPAIDRRYQKLYDLSPLAILVVNAHGIIRDMNPQAAHLLERTPEDLLYQHVDQILLSAANRTKGATGDFCVITSNGVAKSVHVDSYDMESKGELLRYFALTDVAHRRSAEGQNDHLAYPSAVHQMDKQGSLAATYGSVMYYYQPLVDVRSGRIIGAEALFRWVRPSVGLVPFQDFLLSIDEEELEFEVSQSVLENVCLQQRQWMEKGLPPMRMSMNCTPCLLLHSQFLERLKGMLSRTGIQPELLTLIVKEDSMADRFEAMLSRRNELVEFGIKLALDVSGIGSRSLHFIKQLDVDAIMVDCSSQANLQTEPDQVRLHTLIAMSYSSGKRVIAKGVETFEQWELLSALGCDQIQGYFVSRPLEALDFVRYMHQKKLGA